MEEIARENLSALESRYRATSMIVSAQIVFTVILTGAVWLFATAGANSISRQTQITLWAAIIFLAVGAFVLRRMFFRWDRLKDIAMLKGVTGLLKTLQNNAIILAVFATLLTVIGCVVAVLSGEALEAIRAEIVSLVVFSINYPRKSVWEKIAAGLQKE